MTKADLAWLAIRVIGLYLAVEALASAVQIGIELYALDRVNIAIDRGMDVEKYMPGIYGSIATQSFYLVLYAVLSFYFLRKGRFLHGLLMYTTK